MTKYDKADKLRKDCNFDSARWKKIKNEWEKQSNKSITIKERQKIDKMYQSRANSCEKKAIQSYEYYYNYIHSAFHRDDINKAMKLTRNIMSRSFMLILQKLDQKRMKKGWQMSA